MSKVLAQFLDDSAGWRDKFEVVSYTERTIWIVAEGDPSINWVGHLSLGSIMWPGMCHTSRDVAAALYAGLIAMELRDE